MTIQGIQYIAQRVLASYEIKKNGYARRTCICAYIMLTVLFIVQYSVAEKFS